MNIEKKLSELEQISLQLEPDVKQREKLLSKVNDYCNIFLSDIEERKAFEANIPSNAFRTKDLKEEPSSIDECLKFLQSQVDYIGLNPASGGHLGYIPGGGIYTTALGDYMADITNRYAGIAFGGPGAVRMENMLIRWTADLMGYPESSLGNITSGGSIANLIAITTARDAKEINSLNVRDSVIYMTGHTHHCVDKAIRIAGLGECLIRRIKLNEKYEIDIDDLRNLINKDVQDGLNPFLIVASAGTTDVGAIDDLKSISKIAQDHDIWFHVDAAYGGYFIMVEELKHKFAGIELSDSFVIDPHKSLFLSYGTGIVLVRNGRHLYNSHYYKANYMKDAKVNMQEPSPADLSPELTKHFRGLRFWLSMKLFGLKAFRAGLYEKHLLCLYFMDKVKELGFQVGPEPALSVGIYRYSMEATDIDINEFNEALVKNLHKDGRVFVSSTTIDGEVWLRIAILAFRSHKSTIDKCLEMLQECVLITKNQLGLID